MDGFLNIADRFLDKIKEERFGCWLWLAALDPDGYGVFHINAGRGVKKQERAHRFSYEFFKGPIPSGLELDHLCRVRDCVNPDHLEVVTNEENIRRGEVGKRNGEKTHCKRGHEFTPENTYTYKPPGQLRQCKACNKMRRKK